MANSMLGAFRSTNIQPAKLRAQDVTRRNAMVTGDLNELALRKAREDMMRQGTIRNQMKPGMTIDQQRAVMQGAGDFKGARELLPERRAQAVEERAVKGETRAQGEYDREGQKRAMELLGAGAAQSRSREQFDAFVRKNASGLPPEVLQRLEADQTPWEELREDLAMSGQDAKAILDRQREGRQDKLAQEKTEFEQRNQPLVQVYDQNSPTGTRMRTREEAAGQPGKPASGMSLTVGADGEVSFTQGPSSDLTKSTRSKVEQKILTAGDTLSQLTSIRARFKPEFQQIGTRLKTGFTGLKSKLNLGNITEAERAEHEEYSAYRADAGQLFALTLKDLSGVAINPTEFKRAEAWLPNPGTGLFDGDNPIQLMAKLDRFEEFTRKALMKHSYIQRHGMGINDIDVDEMPGLMRERGGEIEKELFNQGVSGKALKTAIMQRLADEFGLVVY